jgi:hypothetical protein
MWEFIFICPVTAYPVQAYAEDSAVAADYYEAIQCTACKGVHLVNPRSGRLAELNSQRLRAVLK